MDGIKLNNWKEKFLSEVQVLRMRYDSYFRPKAFDDCFVLEVDNLSGTLKLGIVDPQMPGEIKGRLEDLLIETMPEDSV